MVVVQTSITWFNNESIFAGIQYIGVIFTLINFAAGLPQCTKTQYVIHVQ